MIVIARRILSLHAFKHENHLPRKGTPLETGGTLSITSCTMTVIARRIVTDRETFSPESTGRRKVNDPTITRIRQGITWKNKPIPVSVFNKDSFFFC